MTDEWSQVAANGIIHAATVAFQAWEQNSYEFIRPSVLFKPTLSKDGDKWCFLLGDSLQDGVAGFGDTPYLAAYDFDKVFNGR